jgi:hypothetical protein
LLNSLTVVSLLPRLSSPFFFAAPPLPPPLPSDLPVQKKRRHGSPPIAPRSRVWNRPPPGAPPPPSPSPTNIRTQHAPCPHTFAQPRTHPLTHPPVYPQRIDRPLNHPPAPGQLDGKALVRAVLGASSAIARQDGGRISKCHTAVRTLL